MQDKFWENKSLAELSLEEWEALCSRCGLCCLEKVEDQGQIFYSRVACQLFDSINCCCSNYAHRHEIVPECQAMNANNIKEYYWLPPTCAYRRIQEGKSLPEWHYLICGDKNAVHTTSFSAKGCEVYNPEIDFEEVQLYSLELNQEPRKK